MAIGDVNEQVDKILTDSNRKYELFMGHIVRKKVQDEAIPESFDWVKNGVPKERLVVYIDFKMKVEPQRYCGATGCTWH